MKPTCREWMAAIWLLGAACSGCSQAEPTPSRSETEAPAQAPKAEAIPSGLGNRVFVVERESETLAVYDLATRGLLPQRIGGLGDLRHAVMTFSPALDYGYVATRNGKLTRIDLTTLETAGEVFTSQNSIDIAINHDGRFVATAEYAPGGLTILDTRTLAVAARFPSPESRVTGVVDARGGRFVCVLMEKPEIWVIAPTATGFELEHRVPIARDAPYDAMITPDGRYYVVGHMGSEFVSVLDLKHVDRGAKQFSIVEPGVNRDRAAPVKLPHMASWAVAGHSIFVPMVGEAALAVLDRSSFEYKRSIRLRGHPVYAVRSPTEDEIWVSFSGEENDAFVQVVDVESLAVVATLEVGGRIYHMDFTPRGSHVLVSANRSQELVLIDAVTRAIVDREPVASPSGIFGVWRAFRVGL